MSPFKLFLPWVSAALICLLTVYVRVALIQPPEVSQVCDASGPTLWVQLREASLICKVRAAFIVTYAWFGLGYAAMVLSLLTLVYRNAFFAWLALCVGGAGLVLYCFEPAAVSLAIGAVVLAGVQSRTLKNGVETLSTQRHGDTENGTRTTTGA